MVQVQEYFDLKYGVNLEFTDMQEDPNGIPFVSRTEKNNGVVGRVKPISGIKPNPANTISVAGGGSVMASFLQKEPYYSGRDLYYLTPKIDLTERELLFYCMCLKANSFRYSYGRQANKTLKYLEIPARNQIPKYVYNLQVQKLKEEPISKKRLILAIQDWKYFKVSDLFNVTGSKSITKEKIAAYGAGSFPYVVTSSENNGVEGLYNYSTEKGNLLTIDSATVGSCFYQPIDFSASDHVEKLIPKFKLNKYIAMFLVTIFKLEMKRYGYGRKFAQKRISDTIIKLPVDKNGNPDWQFMEDYIKSLPYSSNL